LHLTKKELPGLQIAKFHELKMSDVLLDAKQHQLPCFHQTKSERIAVKVITHLGDEVMKVFKMQGNKQRTHSVGNLMEIKKFTLFL
jgi:hypothetical protein